MPVRTSIPISFGVRTRIITSNCKFFEICGDHMKPSLLGLTPETRPCECQRFGMIFTLWERGHGIKTSRFADESIAFAVQYHERST